MPPDRWLVLTVRASDPDLREELVEPLLALGGAAVEEGADRLTTYLPDPGEPGPLMERARRRVEQAAGGRPLEVLWDWRANEDWAREWRRGLRPRRVGERIIVTPTWEEPEAGADDVVISIDPQMAFGTGEHATTRGVLRLLEDAVHAGDRILDVGAGSAILAIAAARLGAARVLAVEADPEAIDNADENVRRNGVAGRVTLSCAAVDEAWLEALGPARFDVIAANVLSGVIEPLLPAFRRSLADGGRALVGGILEEEATRLLDTARRAGFALDAEDREAGWWSARLV